MKLTNNKYTIISLIIGILITIGGFLTKLQLRDTDSAIIRYGLSRVRTQNTFAFILIIIGILLIFGSLIVTFILQQKSKQKYNDEITKIKNDPLTPINNLKIDLKSIRKKQPRYAVIIDTAFDQIDTILDRSHDIHLLSQKNDHQVLIKINQVVDDAKKEIISNIESIRNRLTVDGDIDPINKRLGENEALLKQTRILLNESINYLDSTSNTSQTDLESMIIALQTLTTKE